MVYMDTYKYSLNAELLAGFMENAKFYRKRMMVEIHATHKVGYPYNRWRLDKSAKKKGLVLHDTVPFCKKVYPDYQAAVSLLTLSLSSAFAALLKVQERS